MIILNEYAYFGPALSRREVQRAARRERVKVETAHIRKLLRHAENDPAVQRPSLIGRPRLQQIAKLYRRMPADGPATQRQSVTSTR